MSTMSEAVESVLASREVAERIAAAREEQREACARHLAAWMATRNPEVTRDTLEGVRATPLEATPLVDRIKALEADAQMLSDDDDACHRLLDKALDEGSLSTTSMETLLERLPRLIADRDAKEEARSQEAESQSRWMRRAQDAEARAEKAERDLGNVFENLDLNSLNASLDALRAQRDTLQATLCDLSEAFDKRGAQRDAAVEALEAAAKSLESASAHYKVDDDNVRAYCLSRATVARAALLLARGTP